MTTRADIAAALTDANIPIGTTTLKASPKRPSVLAAGVAWPMTGSWDRSEAARAYIRNWEIWLVLPQEETAAVAWLEDNLGEVDDALVPVMFVDRYEPIMIPTGEGELFGALITGHSE